MQLDTLLASKNLHSDVALWVGEVKVVSQQRNNAEGSSSSAGPRQGLTLHWDNSLWIMEEALHSMRYPFICADKVSHIYQNWLVSKNGTYSPVFHFQWMKIVEEKAFVTLRVNPSISSVGKKNVRTTKKK